MSVTYIFARYFLSLLYKTPTDEDKLMAGLNGVTILSIEETIETKKRKFIIQISTWPLIEQSR